MLEFLLTVFCVWIFVLVPIAFIIGIISYRVPEKYSPPVSKPAKPLPPCLRDVYLWRDPE